MTTRGLTRLRRLLAYLDLRRRVGGVGVRLYDDDAESLRDHRVRQLDRLRERERPGVAADNLLDRFLDRDSLRDVVLNDRACSGHPALARVACLVCMRHRSSPLLMGCRRRRQRRRVDNQTNVCQGTTDDAPYRDDETKYVTMTTGIDCYSEISECYAMQNGRILSSRDGHVDGIIPVSAGMTATLSLSSRDRCSDSARRYRAGSRARSCPVIPRAGRPRACQPPPPRRRFRRRYLPSRRETGPCRRQPRR